MCVVDVPCCGQMAYTLQTQKYRLVTQLEVAKIAESMPCTTEAYADILLQGFFS